MEQIDPAGQRDEDPRARIDPEHFENPGKAPAFGRRLNMQTGWEIGLPMAVAGGAALFFAYFTGLTPLWILGGALLVAGVAVLVLDKRL